MVLLISIFEMLSSYNSIVAKSSPTGECKIFCVNEKIHTKKEVASVE